jgi:hypothetical protein
VVLLLSAPAASQDVVGYIINLSAPSGNAQPDRHHHTTWYAHDQWWTLVDGDTVANDPEIWEMDGAIPGTPGDEGGWSGTAQVVETTSGTELDAFYDPNTDTVHVLHLEATSTYDEWDWDATDQRYEKDTTLGTISSGLGECSNQTCRLVVDGTGQAWVTYINAGLYALPGDTTGTFNDSFGTAHQISADAVQTAASFVYTDDTNGPSIGVVTWDTNSFMVLYKHDDGDGDTTWSASEEIWDVGSAQADDHIKVCIDPDTDLLYIIAKRGLTAGIVFIKGEIGGSWDTPVVVTTDSTDTTPCVHVNADNILVAWEDTAGTDHTEYKTSDKDTISFGSEIKAVGNTQAATGIDCERVPNANGTLFLTLISSNRAWYNIIDAPAGATTRRAFSVMDR